MALDPMIGGVMTVIGVGGSLAGYGIKWLTEKRAGFESANGAWKDLVAKMDGQLDALTERVTTIEAAERACEAARRACEADVAELRRQLHALQPAPGSRSA